MKTFLLFCMTFWIGMANASLIEINAQNAGWYNQLGLHTTGNPNYIAGNLEYSIGAMDYSFIYHKFICIRYNQNDSTLPYKHDNHHSTSMR